MTEGQNRQITESDIEFLKNLQHEMLTQDTICQANPRFWVVAQTDKEWGVEDGYADGFQFIINDEIEINTIEKLADYLVETEYITEKQAEEFVNNMPGNLSGDDIEDFFNEMEIENYPKVRIVNYRNKESSIQSDTFFLTNREAKEHIKANYYHYNDTVHTYAMTAWRSPQVERLYDILLNVDFEQLKANEEKKLESEVQA